MFLHRFIILCIAGFLFASQAVAAPNIQTKTFEKFTRLSFQWNAPVSMRVDSRGNQLVLKFSKTITSNISGIKSDLAGYVQSVSLSKSKKTVTIKFAEAYRVRQFLSKTTNGVDIFTKDIVAPPPPPPSSSVAAQKPAVTSKEAKKAPVIEAKARPITKTENPIFSTKPASTKKIAPSIAPVIATPKKPALAKKELEQKARIAASRQKTVYSTKTPTKVKAPLNDRPAAKTLLKEEKTAKPLVAPSPKNSALLSAKAPEVVKVAPTKKNAESQKSTAASDAELLIGLVKGSKVPTLEFAWSARTAMATFARNNDVWVVFSRKKPVNIANLVSILPEGLLGYVEEFALPAHTVLRFSSDRPVYPQAAHVAGSYHWRIQFHDAPKPARKAIRYSVEKTGKTNIIRFSNVDAAPAAVFYDPVYEDRLLIAPLYGSNQALNTAKHLHGTDILASGQGVAIRTDDDSVRMTKDRADLLVTNKGILPMLKNLPFLPGQLNVGEVPVEANNVVIAYHKFFDDAKNFSDSRARIARELADASAQERPKKLHELAGMYVIYGFGPETAKILTDIKKEYPQYYRKNHLAIMHTAALFLAERLPESAALLKSAKIDHSILEAQLWNDVLGLYGKSPLLVGAQEEFEQAPKAEESKEKTAASSPQTRANILTAPASESKMPVLNLLKYQERILRYYPPKIRQKISVIGASNYIQRKQYKNAVTVFNLLSDDGILAPIQPFAEYLFGRIAAEKGKTERALKVWNKLIERDEDPFITARADLAVTNASYKAELINIEEAIARLEKLRLDWRYDSLEQELLRLLGQLYKKNKQYDLAMRTWKEYLNYYPNAPDVLQITIDMNQLFADLYVKGLADDLEPLKSLALFYEFRYLIPVDERGDKIVRKLADRLAKVDLNDRAVALLAHQVKFRSEGEERAKLGAKLALLHLQAGRGDKALEALEATNFGALSAKLATIRTQLMAESLAKIGSAESAFSLLRNDNSPEGVELKLRIVWDVEDWPNVIELIEDQLALREDFAAPLNAKEQERLLRLALAYSFKGSRDQLQYLRDYYFNLIPDNSKSKASFDYLTDHTSPLDSKNLDAIAAQITGTQALLEDLRGSLQDVSDKEEAQPNTP